MVTEDSRVTGSESVSANAPTETKALAYDDADSQEEITESASLAYEVPWIDVPKARKNEKRNLAGDPNDYWAMPALSLVFNPEILPFLKRKITGHHHLMRVALYCIDTALVQSIADRIGREKTEVYIVLDKNQAKNPSCSKQRRAMMLLKLWGVKIRVRTPAKGIMSAQHEKVWLFDHNLLFLGSANATENSLTNCEETNVAITDHECIEQWAEHFLRLWNTAQDPDWTDIEYKEELALESVRRRPARERSLPRMI